MNISSGSSNFGSCSDTVLVERIRALKEFLSEEVFWDLISAEVDQIESPLSSPLTLWLHLSEHLSKLKQTIKKARSFKATIFRVLM